MHLLIRPKIKICGISKTKTLDCCIKNKVNFFGMIFYSKSPRNIKFEQALNLLSYSQNKPISSVGVFVNEPIDNLKIILKR